MIFPVPPNVPLSEPQAFLAINDKSEILGVSGQQMYVYDFVRGITKLVNNVSSGQSDYQYDINNNGDIVDGTYLSTPDGQRTQVAGPNILLVSGLNDYRDLVGHVNSQIVIASSPRSVPTVSITAPGQILQEGASAEFVGTRAGGDGSPLVIN
jgi:hypothetical protein